MIANGKPARLMALAFLISALAVAGWFGIRLRPHPAKSPAGSRPHITELSPSGIIETVATTSPFDQAEVADSFRGTPVDWRLHLFGVDKLLTDSTKLLVTFTDGPSLVTLFLPIEGNEYLRLVKKGEEFRVKGFIQRVNSHATVVGLESASVKRVSDSASTKK